MSKPAAVHAEALSKGIAEKEATALAACSMCRRARWLPSSSSCAAAALSLHASIRTYPHSDPKASRVIKTALACHAVLTHQSA